jgi:hypothetical protein
LGVSRRLRSLVEPITARLPMPGQLFTIAAVGIITQTCIAPLSVLR